MTDILFKANFFLQIVDDSVYFHPCITAFFIGGKLLFERALFSAEYGGFNQNFTALWHSHNPVRNLVDGLTADFSAALRTVRNANPCKQKAEIIVNFGNRSHS